MEEGGPWGYQVIFGGSGAATRAHTTAKTRRPIDPRPPYTHLLSVPNSLQRSVWASSSA